jgi:hypothetical protein
MNMAQNVSNTIDFKPMSDMDYNKITQHIKHNPEMFSGLNTSNRNNLLEFAKTKPGSEERQQIINKMSQSTVVEPQKQVIQQPDIQIDKQKPVEKPVENTVVDKSAEKPDVKIQELTDRLNAVTAEAQKHRQGASRVGNELDKIRKEKEDLEKKLKEVQLNQSNQSTQPIDPVEPVEPDPDSFDDGILDDGYKNAIKQYNKNIKDFFKKQIQNVKTQSTIEMENRLSDLIRQSSQSLEIANEYRTDKNTIVADTEWKSLWNRAIDIQKSTGLTTAVNPKIISDTAFIISNPDKHTPEQVKAASDAMEALKTSDPVTIENYNKLSSILNKMYDYSTGYPVRKSIVISDDDEYALSAAIRMAGLNLPPIPKKQSQRDILDNRISEEKKTENFVRATPASEIGAGDSTIQNQLTTNEGKKRLQEMAIRISQNKNLNSDVKFMQEFNTLRKNLGYR